MAVEHDSRAMLRVITDSSASNARAGLRATMGKVLYVVSEDWYFARHRLALAKEACRLGYEVVVCTRISGGEDKLRTEVFRVHDLPMQRGWFTPIRDLWLVVRLWRILRRERPEILHCFALKPVVLGVLAGKAAGVPNIIATLPGLGYLALKGPKARTGLRHHVIQACMQVVLRGCRCFVTVQNANDLRHVLRVWGVPKSRTALIRGSGVDIRRFKPGLTPPDGKVRVLMASRLIKPKGVEVFVQASQLVRQRREDIEFLLAGEPDLANPEPITREQVESWKRLGSVECLGFRDDMEAVLREVDIAVLPTHYGEGVPKSLLEAAACAKAIVTTNIPGCRDIVRNGFNGLLVPPKDALALVEAIIFLADHPEERVRMGQNGRKLVERRFGQDRIVAHTIALYCQPGRHQRQSLQPLVSTDDQANRCQDCDSSAT